jgi:beta-1,4-N-acetylglucosaminyltransferase
MKVALVCSHGGHLTEMLQLSDAWRDHDTFWITYASPRTRGLERAYLLTNIGINPFRMAIATLRTAWILLRERPDVVISTGSEIAIPAFYLARLIRARTVFIEVWTRVRRPTGTGRLVYPVSDHFFVQWPQLLQHYGPKAQFGGTLL